MMSTVYLLLFCLCVGLSAIETEEECPAGSLFTLNLAELLKKSNTTAGCLDEARNTFKSKYDQRDFGLWVVNYNSGDAISESNVLIKIFDYELAKILLNNFGDLINNLEILFERFNATRSVEFVRLIDDKCSKSLKSINLVHCNGSALDEFTNTFNTVESLTFSTEKLHVKSNNKLNKTFSNVNHLNIEYTKLSDWKFIDGSFANLKTFRVIFSERKSDNSVRKSDITSFLKHNAQINDLTIVQNNLLHTNSDDV